MSDDAFGSMIVAYRPLLLHVAEPLVGYDNAEDACQETYLRAWRARGGFDGRNPANWLATICANWCRDTRRRRTSGPWEPLPDDLPAREPDPEDAALAAERDATVRAAIGRLCPAQRAAATGRYLGERTYHETAAWLGVPETTLRMQLHRARTTLRRTLATEGRPR